MKYRVEVFQDNEWYRYSAHKNEEFAVINAETINQSRKCDVRVIQGSNIIKFFEGKR